MKTTGSLTYHDLVKIVGEADGLGRAAASGAPLTQYRVVGSVAGVLTDDIASGLSGWATIEIREANGDLRRALGRSSSRARRLSLFVGTDLGRGIGRAWERRVAYGEAFTAHLRAAGLRAFVLEALS